MCDHLKNIQNYYLHQFVKEKHNKTKKKKEKEHNKGA